MMPRITSRQNAVVKSVLKLKQKKHRDLEKQFIIEGSKLFEEAAAWHIEITSVFVTSKWLDTATDKLRDTLAQLSTKGVPVYESDPSVFQALSDLKMPEGILCTAKKINIDENIFGEKCKKDGRFFESYVILDDVQDPGNVGTIIRTADAAGFNGIICSPKTADIYNEKVLRGAMGSVFHLPILQSTDLCQTITVLKNQGICIIGTSLKSESTTQLSLNPKSAVGLILGNESRGMSPEVEGFCDILCKLPMYGHAESLNVSVAAGILMYDIARMSHQ